MTSKIVPTSPNWYCSKVLSGSLRGTLVFGARHEVFVYDVQQLPMKFSGVFTGHRQKVTTLSLDETSSLSDLCCSASEDGHVKLWHVDTLDQQSEHCMHTCRVTAICWSQTQSDLIITGDEGGSVGVWQFDDNRQSVHKPEKGAIQVMASSPKDASIVAIGYKTGQILLVDVKRGATVMMRLRGHDEEIHSLSWCSVPGEDFKPSNETQDITDLETFGIEDSWRKKPSTSSSSGDFGQDGWLLASGSKDRTIRVWSTSKGRQLLLLKMPNPGRRGDRSDDGGKARLWLTLLWSQQSPNQIISSSQSGDLLLWDITKSGKDKCRPFHTAGRGHSRLVFSICPVGQDSSVLCTVSMDRTILLWDAGLQCQVAAVASLGGFCYTIRGSPFDPGRIALGVGDSMIRLWNLNVSSGFSDMIQLWQGIRSKVTALCWHPKREGVLAYGTDDGRVGIYDTLSKKPPHISTTYHRRTVYVVAWGPPSASSEDEGGPSWSLYSCGDGNILEHNPSHLDKEARSISKLIQTVNPAYRNQTKVPTQSEISWSPDFAYVAVGNDDGTVEIYLATSFTLVATVQVLHKLINCVEWHPHVTMASPDGSKYKDYVAIGGNESSVCVVDLNKVHDQTDSGEPLHLVESIKKLEGHCQRITNLAWSPYSDELLVSVSYDGNAIVWNIGDGSVLACYSGHLGKLLSVHWNGLDPGEVITGGDDFTVHRWRVEDHPVQEGQLGRKKDKKKKKKASSTAMPVKTDVQTPVLTELIQTGDKEEDEEIAALLENKRQELLQKEAGIVKENTDHDAGKVSPRNDFAPESFDGGTQDTTLYEIPDGKGDNKTRPRKQDLSYSKEKKKKQKSMFPEMNKRDNMRGKAYILEDIETLARLVYSDSGKSDALGEDLAHLGLFLGRRSVYTCLKLEGEHHRNNDNMEYFYQLEIWKGNINAVLRVARQRDELSDWLVAMAPMASYDTWTSVCEDYALQLEADGQYHKAASYFLACHKVYEAIRLFKRHKLFKEAIALAKVRLSPLDPALEELYTLWAQQLTKDGNYEQAAKCHLAMKQVQDAAKLLARRYDQSSLRTAANISLIANEKQQGIMYTHKLVQQYLAKYEWKEAYNSVQRQKELQVFLATSSIHEMLTREMTKMNTLNIDTSFFTQWEEKTGKKTPLPDFILDPGDFDKLSPWQPRLVEGHTFPHYVLRTWYSQLDVAMDTTSLEDMYKTLCLLHAGRQSQVDLPQVLIQVSMDLTLCMLSLLMSETPTAMSHLLQAVGSLHETGHVHAMQGLLQVFLPQGPKYILKLQQEVTAMRVMISMDTHSHVDGASKVHTLKRYLSDLKDENIVNTSSMRCRELDCLRAYYYVAILNFLKESCDAESQESTENCVINKSVPNTVTEAEKPVLDDSKDKNGKSEMKNSSSVDDTDVKVEVSAETERIVENSGKENELEENQSEESAKSDASKVDCAVIKDESADIHGKPTEGKSDIEVGKSDKLCSDQKSAQSPGKQVEKGESDTKTDSRTAEAVLDSGVNLTHSIVPSPPVLNATHYSVTMSQLYQISQGLLWDVQAKRFALTETLGYIHKAISQLLLSKNPKPSENTVAMETVPQTGGSSQEEQTVPESSSNSQEREGKSKDSDNQVENPEAAAEASIANLEGAVGFTAGSSSDTSDAPLQGTDSHRPCEHHKAEWHDGHICHAALSHHFDHIMTTHTPHSNEVSPVDVVHSETEFKCSFFEVCSSCELLQKSRKILFEDEPHFHGRPDGGLRDVTNITNPAKYINMPDEWYSMPADLKYFKPYVTMATLKDEQEYVMTELKRGPDSNQSPFPGSLESIKSLLDVSLYSPRVTAVERKEFAQKVIAWALNFAVTSQQKHTFMALLQTHMDT